MPHAHTPGQVCYETWERTLHGQGRLTTLGQWGHLAPGDQAAWEAAAQAVLDHADFPPLDLRLEEDPR